jgi:hypothetical protein
MPKATLWQRVEDDLAVTYFEMSFAFRVPASDGIERNRKADARGRIAALEEKAKQRDGAKNDQIGNNDQPGKTFLRENSIRFDRHLVNRF